MRDALLPTDRRVLAVAVSRGRQVAGAIVLAFVAAVFLTVAAGFAAFTLVARSTLGDGFGDDTGVEVGTVVGFAVAAGLVLVVVGLVLAAVAVFRTGAWIEGTVLTARRLGTRAVDLATARRVWIDSRRESTGGGTTGPDGTVSSPTGQRSVPRLNVAAADGRTLTLRLVGGHDVLLPAADLRALADLVDASPAADARETAGWLRGQAADPDRFYR